MAKTANPKQPKSKGDFLCPYGPSLGMQKFVLPGMEGENPLLEFVLKTLGGKSRRVLRERLKTLLVFDFQAASPGMANAWHAIRRPEMLDYAVRSMEENMRLAADLWIDSGKSLSDPEVDSPMDRNVEIILPGRSFSLFHLFENRYFLRHPQFTGMYKDGTQQIKKHWPRLEERDYALGLVEGLKDYGTRMALYYFGNLLNSSDSRRIARCDFCKRYFAYERNRLRTVKHGVFCPLHSGKGAARRTVASRTRRLETAARGWFRWESKHKKQPDFQWVADQVNESHGTAFGRRWVSQNLAEIQKRVEALRNAKG